MRKRKKREREKKQTILIELVSNDDDYDLVKVFFLFEILTMGSCFI